MFHNFYTDTMVLYDGPLAFGVPQDLRDAGSYLRGYELMWEAIRGYTPEVAGGSRGLKLFSGGHLD